MKAGNSFRTGRHAATARGFTILELVVVIAIVGVLASMAFPSLREMVLGQRIKTAVADVHASLIYARSEAIKRGQPVATCASADGAACAGATNWAIGWIVFVDPDGDGAPAAVADILKRQTAESGITLTGTGTYVSYRGDGRLTATVADFVASTPGLAVSRCVRISVSGQPNTYKC